MISDSEFNEVVGKLHKEVEDLKIDRRALELLLATAERKKKEIEVPSISKIVGALAIAQGKFATLKSEREVTVTGEKAAYKFRYAELHSLLEVVRKPLSEAGIAVVQVPEVTNEMRNVTVITKLLHVSGESLEGRLTVPVQRPGPMGIGAAITFARRYTLLSLLGLAQADEPDELGELAPGVPPPLPRPLQDSAAGRSSTPVESPAVTDAVEQISVKIREAQTQEALDAIKPAIALLSSPEKLALRPVWAAAQAALKGST